MTDPSYPDGWAESPEIAVAKLQVRGGLAADRLSALIGFEAPPRANSETRAGGLACAAIAPGEWLFTGPSAALAALMDRATTLLADELALFTDLTAGRATGTFRGEQAREWLSCFTSLDLSDAAFPSGSATRAPLGDVVMVLARTGDRPDYRITVDQSTKLYVLDLLASDLFDPRFPETAR